MRPPEYWTRVTFGYLFAKYKILVDAEIPTWQYKNYFYHLYRIGTERRSQLSKTRFHRR